MFAGTTAPTIYRSTDGGANWQSLPIMTSSVYSAVAEILPSPAYRFGGPDQQVVLSGAGEFYISRSDDSGATWSPSNMDPRDTTWGMAISPNFVVDGTLLAATNSNMQKSSDGGRHFSYSGQGLPYSNTFKVAFSAAFATDQTAFAGMYGSGVGVYKTVDGGANWMESGAGLPIAGGYVVTQVAVSPAYATDHTLFAGIEASGLFRSQDAGATWQRISASGSPYHGVFGLSPNFATDHTIVTPTVDGLKISTNGGETWDMINNAPFRGDWDIYGGGHIFSPNYASDHTLYVATDNGIWAAAIPEPGSSGLVLIIGIAGLGWGRRRA
jgi:photosystem II stability/assembly factor-like uncharacterized protein